MGAPGSQGSKSRKEGGPGRDRGGPTFQSLFSSVCIFITLCSDSGVLLPPSPPSPPSWCPGALSPADPISAENTSEAEWGSRNLNGFVLPVSSSKLASHPSPGPPPSSQWCLGPWDICPPSSGTPWTFHFPCLHRSDGLCLVLYSSLALYFSGSVLSPLDCHFRRILAGKSGKPKCPVCHCSPLPPQRQLLYWEDGRRRGRV